MKWLELFREARRLDRRAAVVNVVEQVHVVAVGLANGFEEPRREGEVTRRVPHLFLRQPRLGRFVRAFAARDAVRARDARNAGLHAHREKSRFELLSDGVHRFGEITPVRMGVHEHSLAALSADEIVKRRSEHLPLDVPEREIDRGDGRHRDGPALPVRASIEEVPDVFGVPRVAADESRNDVRFEVRDDRLLPPVERRIAEPVNPFIRENLQRDEIPPGRANNHFRIGDLQTGLLFRTVSAA